jgi:colicin import membrane protein
MTTDRTTIAPPPRVIRPELDPWRYGWRERGEKQPDGSWRSKRTPLTQQDVLHPQEGDFIVHTPAHNQDCVELKNVAQLRLAGRLGFVVLSDCRIDWGIEGLGAHGPDIAVFENVGAWEPTRGTFYVVPLKAKAVLVIEVTSPSTRDLDLNEKVVDYYRAGVPLYAIVDRREAENGQGISIMGYEATSGGYLRMKVNSMGRLWLEPLQLWLGVEGDQVACFEDGGKRIATYVEVAMRLEAAAQRAEAEAQRAAAAEARAAAETDARLQLEARLRELEAELQRRSNPPS